ncbi:unnamed protein product [Sphagnum balticum]
MYSYSYSYSTAGIDLRSTTAPSKSEATPNLVSASSSSSQNYRTQQQEKQQQQLLLLYAWGGSLNQQYISVLRRDWKKTLVATNEYCGERRMRRRKGVTERRSCKKRRFSCIEFSAKSESIMTEAIELSGGNPEARPREKLGSLVTSLLHHAKCKLSPSLSLSLVVQMCAR